MLAGMVVLVAPGVEVWAVAPGLMLFVPGVPLGAPLKAAAVSDPAGGGFGASTMPSAEGVVEGVRIESRGTEFVVG